MLQAEYQRDQAAARGVLNGKELIRCRTFLENSALITEESKKKSICQSSLEFKPHF